MSGASMKRSISNRTDSRKKHQIRFVISSQGRRVSDMKALRAGETVELEDGDRLIIISDRDTNYAISWENGARIGVEQVNNSHPEFPEMTVASYGLTSVSGLYENEKLETSGSDRGEEDPDGRSDPGGAIIVTEPEEPQP